MNLCDSYSISKMSDTITKNGNVSKIFLLYAPGNRTILYKYFRERFIVVGLAIQTKGILMKR